MGLSQGYDYVELKGPNTILNGAWRWEEMLYKSGHPNFGLMELLPLNLHAF
jgi:hypothetical protein